MKELLDIIEAKMKSAEDDLIGTTDLDRRERLKGEIDAYYDVEVLIKTKYNKPKPFKLSQLVKILDENTSITICYAGDGRRIFKGLVTEKLPEYVLNYFVTLILPSGSNLYVEVHELSTFVGE